ncbi:glutamate-cysteine ligase family protein, partial [Actinoplanes sp. NPDC024001]|uniref:glutamate-cysteine ligase family protein n=1 Tax=Actinoplanes sp. NPDC024001 TaxID=3154598 RepID=UPI0034103439
MTILTEQAAEEFLAGRAFAPGVPGFVGIAVDLLLDPAGAPGGRRPLRHGFLDTRSPRVMTVSGPPSPGLETALRRMADDLGAAGRFAERHRLTVLPQASGTAHPDGPAHTLGTATAGIRVGLEAGLDGGGPLGLGRRWALAHTLAPVLAAAFANSPLRHGRPTG